jgi:predicted nucleic acid-binding protein
VKLIDTSAWIEYLRGTGSETARLVSKTLVAAEGAWCEVIAVELWNGLTANQRKKLEQLETLVTTLEITSAVWLKARTLASLARTAAFSIPTVDIIIAACGAHHRAEIIHHRDEHFTVLQRLNDQSQ